MPSFVKLAKRFGFRIIFSQLLNWNTFTNSEFRKRAVHLRNNQEYEKFKKILKKVSKEPCVSISNLNYILNDNISKN